MLNEYLLSKEVCNKLLSWQTLENVD